MASIREQQPGVWRVVVTASRQKDERGRPVRRIKIVRGLRRDAERVARALGHDFDTGKLTAQSGVTFGGYIEEHWLPAVRTEVRARTAHRYEELLRHHVLPVLGGMRLEDIRAGHIRSVLERARQRGLSPRSVVHVLRVTKGSLKKAVEDGFLSASPATGVRTAKPPLPKLNIPDEAGLLRLLAAAEESPFRVAFTVSAYTGMRRGEIAGLTWGSVNLSAGKLTVQATLSKVRTGDLRMEEPKTERSRRVVTLPGPAVEALGSLPRGLPGALVFPGPDGGMLDPDLLSLEWGKVVRAAGLRRIRLHDLRHAHAVVLYRAGVPIKDISERLGHSTVAFTLDTYVHGSEEDDRQAANAFERALGSAT